MATIKKPQLVGKGTFTLPEPQPLTKASTPGTYVYWEVGSEKRTGVLQAWQKNKAIIQGIVPARPRVVIEVS